MAKWFKRYGMNKVFLYKGVGLTVACAIVEAFYPYAGAPPVVMLYTYVVGQNLYLMWRKGIL